MVFMLVNGLLSVPLVYDLGFNNFCFVTIFQGLVIQLSLSQGLQLKSVYKLCILALVLDQIAKMNGFESQSFFVIWIAQTVFMIN